jgi:hypothetical protein
VGQLYLTNVDFLKNGIPASAIAALVAATVGFLLMRLIGCVSSLSDEETEANSAHRL